MLKTRTLLVSLFVGSLLVRCAGTETPDDGGADAANDSPAPNDSGKKDASIDAAKDAANDVTVPDAPFDAPVDAPFDSPEDVAIDAPADAGLDVVVVDGGSISSISGLVLWLDAAKGVTTNNGSITSWADQSSQANDATAGTAAPTLASSSINSLPAAHFVASSSQYVTVADATSLQWGTGDFFIAVVSKFDNDPTNGIQSGIGAFYTKLGTGDGLLFFANDYDYVNQTFVAGLSNLEDPTPTEVAYAASYNDGTARLYAVQRASGSEYLRVNGSQVASSTSSIDISESGNDVSIGLMIDTYAALDGDIAEIIAVQGTLSSTDRTTIESYLESKYGL